jgi:DNA-binding CsgD family transcriptional regulator
VERRVLRLADSDVSLEEIGRRFGRSPGFVARLIELAELPDRVARTSDRTLRPLERRVLGLRADGLSYAEIGSRFVRSGAFIEQEEALAHHKHAARSR